MILFQKRLIEMAVVRVIALDLRGHGDTNTTDDNDLSIERLTRYTVLFCRQYF